MKLYIYKIHLECISLKEQQYKKKETKIVVKLTIREDKALQLFQAGVVSRVSDGLYHVKSQKDPNVKYEIIPSLNVYLLLLIQ